MPWVSSPSLPLDLPPPGWWAEWGHYYTSHFLHTCAAMSQFTHSARLKQEDITVNVHPGATRNVPDGGCHSWHCAISSLIAHEAESFAPWADQRVPTTISCEWRRSAVSTVSKEKTTRLCGCASFRPLTCASWSGKIEGAEGRRPPLGEWEHFSFAFAKGLCSGLEGW